MKTIRQLLVLLLAMTLCLTMVPGLQSVARAGAGDWKAMNDGLYTSSVLCVQPVTLSSGQEILIGTARDGIYCSADGGAHWNTLAAGLPRVGTGDDSHYACINNIDLLGGTIYACTGLGLYALSPDGSTWSPLGVATLSRSVYCLFCHGGQAAPLFAGTDNGVYWSLDGGKTWSARNTSMQALTVLALQGDATPGSTGIFACTSGGLFKTADDGKTWLVLGKALLGAHVQCLLQDSRSFTTLWAGTATGLARSFDGGESWNNLKINVSSVSVLSVFVDKFDTGAVACATAKGILLSRDGGATWSWVVQTADATISLQSVSWTSIVPSFAAYIGDTAGFCMVSDAGVVRRNNGLGDLSIDAVTYDPYLQAFYAVHGSVLYQAMQGSSWGSLSPDLGNSGVTDLAVDESRPRTMYAATQYGLLQSTDGGANWSQLAITTNDIRGKILCVAVNPADATKVYAGNDYGLYRSDDGFAAAWIPVGPAGVKSVISVSVARDNPKIVYAVGSQSLWRSADNCLTWSKVSVNGIAEPIVSVAVDRANGDHVYVATAHGIRYSSDGGATWSGVSFPPGQLANIRDIALLPDGSMLIGTSAGVWHGTPVNDSVAPQLVLKEPSDREQMTTAVITVAGVATDADSGIASVLVNGSSVLLSATGEFAVSVVLRPGDNTVTVEATDMAGNSSVQYVHVRYVPPISLTLSIGSTVMRVSDGRTLSLDASPVITGGRTLVAIRPIIDVLEGTISWAAATRTVSIALGTTTITLVLGKNTALVNGFSKAIDATNASVVPQIINGRTMLPLRFVAEALGASVTWTAATQIITITYPAP